MKKCTVILLVATLSFGGSAQVVQAQGSFFFGVIFGAVLFGGDGDGKMSTGSGATVLYTLHRASERVNSPLNVRLSAIEYHGYRAESVEVESGSWKKPNKVETRTFKGLTILEIFKSSVPESEKYEILQVVRVPRADNTSATIWFAYIEKEKVVPLEKLPVQK